MMGTSAGFYVRAWVLSLTSVFIKSETYGQSQDKHPTDTIISIIIIIIIIILIIIVFHIFGHGTRGDCF